MSTFFVTLLIVTVAPLAWIIIKALHSSYGWNAIGLVFGVALVASLVHAGTRRAKPSR